MANYLIKTVETDTAKIVLSQQTPKYTGCRPKENGLIRTSLTSKSYCESSPDSSIQCVNSVMVQSNTINESGDNAQLVGSELNSVTTSKDMTIETRECNDNSGSEKSSPSVQDLRHSDSDNSDLLTDDDKFEITNAELGLSEDHFSRPEGHFCMSTVEELEMAIENCRDMILESQEKTEKRKKLVKKLIQLRMKLQEIKDGPEVLPPDMKLVLGHRFFKKPLNRPKHYCEKCTSIIWGMLQTWHQCMECGFSCHGKCLNLLTRTCASVKVLENPTYIMDINPEEGLSNQKYRCAECHSHIMFTFPLSSLSCGWIPFSSENSWVEPRVCDYNGQYYCPNCHWNSLSVIPARVLHNWDFEQYKVCRASKQFLRLMKTKAVIKVEVINPRLFAFVEDMSLVRKLREDILIMKKYFMSCKNALQSKLLLLLTDRQHFVDNADVYSMQDLMDINSGVLQVYLSRIHSTFAQHIKNDCEICKGQGYYCELCDQDEILFPFDDNAAVCSHCSWTFHSECFLCNDRHCPRCKRKHQRTKSSS